MNLNRFCYLLLIVSAIGSTFTAHPIVSWLLLANVLTLVIYGVDKTAARKGWRRVPESTLLVFGLVGGWPARWRANNSSAIKRKSSHSKPGSSSV
ncbi:uncharacterized membrane protein YsdA (DUF1294 family) [Lelliottia sp. 489]